MAWSVKCLPFKHEDLSLDSQEPSKSLSLVEHISKSNAGDMMTGTSLVVTMFKRICELQTQKETLSQ